MKQKWKRALVRRRLFVTILILLQAGFLFYLISSTSATSEVLRGLLTVISIGTVLHIISKQGDPNAKLTWVFLILLVPIVGGLLYLLYSLQRGTNFMRKLLARRRDVLRPIFYLPNAESGMAFSGNVGKYSPLLKYMHGTCGYPAYDHTQSEYLSPGQAFFSRLLSELEKAEKYIFLEFFIIEEGTMWNSILEILERKAKEGVDVRIMYDDVGCFLTLPSNYHKTLEAKGIQCRKFHPFQPFLSSVQNQRDHRKILVIDGKVAFTGGANLADEYINAYEKHGYWQDAALCLQGKAAWSFTLMFLQLWDYWEEMDLSSVLSLYPTDLPPLSQDSQGIVQPYADSPMDQELTGHSAYLRIIQSAQDYVYIATPYLIIDDILMRALTLAAKSGVDVRIITPYIPDKPPVHQTTRSYYPELIEAGVRIYEFTPGFMHAKVSVSDDSIASVGSVNMDYRSLYLHFECGCLLYDCPCIQDIKADYLNILQKCHLVRLEECKGGFFYRITQQVLRLFAPLL